MIIVSSREFRANQRKYLSLAKTKDVVITSKSQGSYRLVPVREEDCIINEDDLYSKIERGIAQYAEGKIHRKRKNEGMEDYLRRLINEE